MAIQKLALVALSVLAMTGGTMAAADPIEGTWQTHEGADVGIATCDQGYCLTVSSGQYAGTVIGRMTPKRAGYYEGDISRPGDSQTYSGKAEVKGDTLTITGCVAMVLCSASDWSRK